MGPKTDPCGTPSLLGQNQNYYKIRIYDSVYSAELAQTVYAPCTLYTGVFLASATYGIHPSRKRPRARLCAVIHHPAAGTRDTLTQFYMRADKHSEALQFTITYGVLDGPPGCPVSQTAVFVLQFREMVYLTKMHKMTILQIIGYGDRTRTQAEVVRLFQEKYPELPPIYQDTISKIEKQFRERGHMLLGSPKDKIDNNEKSGIYEISCKDCDQRNVTNSRELEAFQRNH
ncbi:hypothetical protein NQ318_014538 [Aromia moschata]|uniref:DUF4817 domain-containing protein n=1 Tax=Aromia moschata TaxID=1265417 RepID=A0AAV8XHP4_9CUCU|nr:hypothetical protein NQ318_014538 [Aromia moschata]